MFMLIGLPIRENKCVRNMTDGSVHRKMFATYSETFLDFELEKHAYW
jgi:hypothetical protein